MSQASSRVLILKHGSLGDIFLMLGALQDIAEHVGSSVDVLTMAPYAKLFKRSPFVDQVYIDNRKSRFKLGYLLGLRQVLNSKNYEQIIDLQNSKRTLFYRRFLAPRKNWCQLGTVAPTEFHSANTDSPVMAKFEAQLSSCGCPTERLLDGDLDWLTEQTSASLKVQQTDKSVVLLPGASAKHLHKIWPRYAELAKLLLEAGYSVFVAPGPDDMDLCRSIPGELAMNDGRWLDFFQLAGVLEKADFVVGNDSGPTHLAASLGTPGLALFSERTAQYSPNMKRRNMDVRISSELSEISARSVFDQIRSSVETKGLDQ